MIQKLTSKQREVLEAITRLTQENGTKPTLRELMIDLGYASTSSVQRHVEALRAKGYLTSEKAWQHGIENPATDVKYIPLIGSVPCGPALMAEENVEGYVPYSFVKLRSKHSNYFFLRASGTSMNLAGIEDGDLLLVKQQETARPGEKIVACLADGVTCKFLGKTDDGWYQLEPKSSDPKHSKPRIMVEPFSVQGVVEHVVKRS
jgi:repressor LexA